MGIAIVALLTRPAKPEPLFRPERTWNVKELLSKYNCAWVREHRRLYSDAELLAMARQMKLPRIVIEFAKRCP